MTEFTALLSSHTRDTEVYEKVLPLAGGAICAPIFREMLLVQNGLWKAAPSEHSNLNLHTHKMASLATHIPGTVPACAPEDSQDAARNKKDVTNKVKEHSVRDALSLRLGGTIQVLTPSGCIDCLTHLMTRAS